MVLLRQASKKNKKEQLGFYQAVFCLQGSMYKGKLPLKSAFVLEIFQALDVGLLVDGKGKPVSCAVNGH